MENVTPQARRPEAAIARRTAERAVETRYSTYVSEVRRLIQAGRTLMRRTGGMQPRVSAIVQEAGLSNQTFYRHFRSKDELLLAILDDGLAQLLSYIHTEMAKPVWPLARVRRWIRCVLVQAVDPQAAEATRPFVANAFRLAERFPAETARSMERIKAPLKAAIREAAAAGEAPAADPERDAEVIYHLAMGWMQSRILDPSAAAETDLDHLVSFVVRSLAAPETPAEATHGT